MGQSFINSSRYYSNACICVSLPESSLKSINFCKNNNIEYFCKNIPNRNAKQISRILKMGCTELHNEEEPIVYMDADIVFQGDILELENLNPNYVWVLSKREGHQTDLRTWKKHYFTKSTVDFVREVLPKLTHLPIDELLTSPVRNCGVIYGNRSLLSKLFNSAKNYYLKILEINKTQKLFSDSDQLCFLLAFFEMQDKIKELPVQFNRMPYHQSYDFKDISALLVPDTIALHLNRTKGLGRELVQSWAKNEKPVIIAESNTRSSVVIPMQTSSIAERALMKNLYSLAVSNKANVYRDEDVGFPVAKKYELIKKISTEKDRPYLDPGLFFIINDHLFMIDHGEYTGHRASWLISKYVTKDILAGIFIEQMDEKLDISTSKIPLLPLAYGTKQPLLWLNQGIYHNLGLTETKKYSVHFIGNLGTNKERKKHAKLIAEIPNSKIEDRGNSKRMSFDEYMLDMTAAKIIWCPPGGRPKTHREIEALCCEIAVMMPYQGIKEQENLIPDVHYICIKNDYSDVKEKVQLYLDHPVLAKIAHNGRLWYERNASDNARAKYILDTTLEIIRA